MESLSFLDLDKLEIKSIEISTLGSLGTCRGVYNLWGITLDLYVMHLS